MGFVARCVGQGDTAGLPADDFAGQPMARMPAIRPTATGGALHSAVVSGRSVMGMLTLVQGPTVRPPQFLTREAWSAIEAADRGAYSQAPL